MYDAYIVHIKYLIQLIDAFDLIVICVFYEMAVIFYANALYILKKHKTIKVSTYLIQHEGGAINYVTMLV